MLRRSRNQRGRRGDRCSFGGWYTWCRGSGCAWPETPSGVITGPSLSRVVPSLQRAILSLQLTMPISQVCYVYDRPLIRLAHGQEPARGHCVRTLNGLLGHPQQSSLRPFPHKRGRKLWGLPLVTHGGSDPCRIHVWESFSE
jgi:hypothetical protein